MAIRIYKPTTPGRRNASVNLHVEVTKSIIKNFNLVPIQFPTCIIWELIFAKGR